MNISVHAYMPIQCVQSQIGTWYTSTLLGSYHLKVSRGGTYLYKALVHASVLYVF